MNGTDRDGQRTLHSRIILWCLPVGIRLNFSEQCSETSVSAENVEGGDRVLGEIVLHISFSQMFNSHAVYILFSLITIFIHLELQ